MGFFISKSILLFIHSNIVHFSQFVRWEKKQFWKFPFKLLHSLLTFSEVWGFKYSSFKIFKNSSWIWLMFLNMPPRKKSRARKIITLQTRKITFYWSLCYCFPVCLHRFNAEASEKAHEKCRCDRETTFFDRQRLKTKKLKSLFHRINNKSKWNQLLKKAFLIKLHV